MFFTPSRSLYLKNPNPGGVFHKKCKKIKKNPCKENIFSVEDSHQRQRLQLKARPAEK
jgi:hypothetical protein